jgi:hypothetical protein
MQSARPRQSSQHIVPRQQGVPELGKGVGGGDHPGLHSVARGQTASQNKRNTAKGWWQRLPQQCVHVHTGPRACIAAMSASFRRRRSRATLRVSEQPADPGVLSVAVTFRVPSSFNAMVTSMEGSPAPHSPHTSLGKRRVLHCIGNKGTHSPAGSFLTSVISNSNTNAFAEALGCCPW